MGVAFVTRPTVRAVLLDADDRVLLQAHLDPDVHRLGGAPATEPAWIAPGGGLWPGEDPAAGIAREVAEETGLTDVTWGPWLWRRTVELRFEGAWRRFEESYRVGRVAGAGPAVRPAGLEERERSTVLGHVWWTLAELRSTEGTVYPPRLAERLAAFLAQGPPAAPLDISADG